MSWFPGETPGSDILQTPIFFGEHNPQHLATLENFLENMTPSSPQGRQLKPGDAVNWFRFCESISTGQKKPFWSDFWTVTAWNTVEDGLLKRNCWENLVWRTWPPPPRRIAEARRYHESIKISWGQCQQHKKAILKWLFNYYYLYSHLFREFGELGFESLLWRTCVPCNVYPI